MPNSEHPPRSRRLEALVETQPTGWFAVRRLVVLGVAVAIAVLAWWFWRTRDHADAPRFRTEPATVGTLVVTVSATGKLQPTNEVEVGSELSGIVERVFVDENDRVRKGDVLARLDVSKLQDNVERSRAALAAASAQVEQADATVAEQRASLARLRRMFELTRGEVPSRSEMDVAEANAQRAEADAASARAGVAQARAALRSDETNLHKASIRSPIDGVVLTRSVDPGQTVAASFQAPVLFTIAEDLAQMELQVDVDEADVGQVEVGQQATFTVDAWPGREYSATISRVGYGSQEKEGVVSYLTVLDVANEDLSLRPGMTGTAEITTQVRENALLVPNAALRFSPTTASAPPQQRNRTVVGALLPRPPAQPRNARSRATGPAGVWVLRDGEPVRIEVTTGATNGRVTEITAGDLEPGTEVITESAGRAS